MLRKSPKAPPGRPWFAVIAAVSGVLITGVIVGVSSAAIPDAGTATFHGCENKATGVLRLIDPALMRPVGFPLGGLASSGRRVSTLRDWSLCGKAFRQTVRPPVRR